MNSSGYQLQIEGNRLIFRTSSFLPVRKSILHSGIYNRELASALAASSVGGTVFIFLSFSKYNKLVIYVFPLLIFAMTFLFFRTVVLKEPNLETVIDRGSGEVSVVVRRPFRVSRENTPLSFISDVTMSHLEFEPPNPDGVRVVERIALQHGTVIPGFGDKRDLYRVELAAADKKTTIFVTEDEREASEVVKKIKVFLGNR